MLNCTKMPPYMQMPGGRGRGRGGGGRGKDGGGHGGRGGGQGQGQGGQGQGQGGQGPGANKGSQRTRGESERSEGDEERCLVCLNKMEVFGQASFSDFCSVLTLDFQGFLCGRVQSSNMPHLHNKNEGLLVIILK